MGARSETGRLDDGVCWGSGPASGGGCLTEELFNQREDHILVKVYLPVAIS